MTIQRDCDPVEQQARQDELDALYKANGRESKEHPLHALYTGLVNVRSESTDGPNP